MKMIDQDKSLTQIQSLLEKRNFEEAINLIERLGERSADMLAAMALTHFLREDYSLSADYYQQALSINPTHPEWQVMLKQAQSNALAEINERVPEPYFFRDLTPERPMQILDEDSSAPATESTRFFLPRFRYLANRLLTFVIEGVKQTLGTLAGYRDKIWTNWYRRPIFLGILTLGYMRNRLNKYNLLSVYPEDQLVGLIKGVPKDVPSQLERFRTANGSWNNLKNPLEGAARTRFLRNTPYPGDEENQGILMTPSPRELSLTFLTRKSKMKEVPFLNMLSVAWIQFQNHDWISYGETMTTEMHKIPLAKDDPARKRYWQSHLLVGKTQKDPWRTKEDSDEPTYLNECTHWWDGSQIYGSDEQTQTWLRSGQNGKLRLRDNGSLPRDKKGIEETGFVRNWWVGLGLMHTLFVREHNIICDHLLQTYPSLEDEELFQTARLINSALMAKIHSLEWNAAINPNKALYQGIQTNWYGLLSSWFQTSKHKKTLNSFQVANSELGGILGNPTEKHGSPFGLTQEFVEVYRMHSLLPEELIIRDLDGNSIANLPISETRQAASGKCMDQYGMANLLYSFGMQLPGQLVLNNYPRFMQELSIPGNPVYDLGAVDILRARERGVPRYNAFRRAMGLKPITSFEDLTTDINHVALLKEAYLGDIELIDLMIGALAEEHRPSGFAFGETIFQIFLLNATRRLQADRFYTSCYTAEYYTQEGLDWIDQNNLKSVLLRHFPELHKTGLSNIQNAFEPWDNGERLDPMRHPLRGYDRSLRPDPWKGDAYK